jgi:LDH2 family malate/lactate/ureidoglycolate dehydrogenase
MTAQHDAAQLTAFARQLLEASRLPADKAAAVAQILVEGDLMGHTTHGLALLANYLNELKTGSMNREGDPLTIAQAPAVLTWDGRRLPGPWLVLRAMEEATQRARTFGSGTVVIRRSHHIACLAAYLKRATDAGFVMLLACSDANSASVAPFGGLDPVFTPNPMAFGIPTSGDPVLVDISSSATTNGMTARVFREGGRMPAQWMIDANGEPTDDPSVLFKDPKGTILPLGGIDSGHKGYGLSLLVEALTGGLAGHGRADPKEGWGATVFVQILDPRAFAGEDEFLRQFDEVARRCRASKPARAGSAVRLPGQRGLELARQQREQGVALHESIMPMLEPWAKELGVSMPGANDPGSRPG